MYEKIVRLIEPLEMVTSESCKVIEVAMERPPFVIDIGILPKIKLILK